MTSKRPQLILASGSPRRIELLKNSGLNPLVTVPEVDEVPQKGETPVQLVRRLSQLKANAVSAEIQKNHSEAIILAADTIVVAPDGHTVFGKPRHHREAQKMLSKLAGRTHTVFTGYSLLSLPHRKMFTRVVRTRVTMRELSRADILRYIENGESMDKAGAYAAQGYGMGLIDHIQGSYTNVVGLPLSQVLEDLENRFDLPLFSWRIQ